MVKDLEFHVQYKNGKGDTKIFTSFDRAAAHAVQLSISNGEDAVIDVVAWSRSAAKAWGGDYGVEQYNEDPEASIHDRIVIKAEDQGRIA